MTLSLEKRLNQILPRITSRDFLDSKGLGNEIGFWIFDYPPEREMDVRDFLSSTVVPALSKQSPTIRCADVNLLELVTDLLQERKLLDKAIALQKTKGNDGAWSRCARCSKKTSWRKKSPHCTTCKRWICSC